MSNFIVNTDIPNLRVVIREGDQYNVNVVPGRITTTYTGSFNTYADLAGQVVTASYALTAQTLLGTIQSASYALTSSFSTTASYVSGAASDWNSITGKPDGLVSSSVQINSGSFSGSFIGLATSASFALTASYVSGAASTWDTINNKPSGLVSSSVQINTGSFSGSFTGQFTGTSSVALNANTLDGLDSTVFATTESNIFTGTQTINNTTNSTLFNNGALTVAGGVGITKDVNISGSLTVLGLLTAVSTSVQYVTSSQLVVTDNKIIVNTNDLLRFGGLSVIDSGSSSPTTASIYWDSLNHHFIYENLSGSAYNSAIIIAGPKNTGTLGNEPELVVGRVPVASGGDHIDSRLASSSIRVDFPSRLTHIEAGLIVTGSISGSVTGSFFGNLVGTSSWASNAISSSFTTTSSFSVSSSRTITSSFAITASSVLGTVSSASYALNADTLDGLNSTVFATTGSNTFVGTQTISGSLLTNADTLIFTGSIFTSGSLSVVGGTITGSLFGTASHATTSSYALTASFIDGGFY